MRRLGLVIAISCILIAPIIAAQLKVDVALVNVVATITDETGHYVSDLTQDDLVALGWSGSPGHVASVARALERVESGEVEYLVARAPNGQPVAKAGIDYAAKPGTGTLWQLATHMNSTGRAKRNQQFR